MQPRSITCLLKGHVRARGLWVSSQVFGMQKSSPDYAPTTFTRLSVGKRECWSQCQRVTLGWKRGFTLALFGLEKGVSWCQSLLRIME